MAGLPLYLMAIPLRRSLAAGMGQFKRGEAEFTPSYCRRNCLGSARISRAGFRRRTETNFNLISLRSARIETLRKSSRSRGRARQHARGMRSPDHFCNDLQQFQPRQILRIDNTYRHVVIINHDQIVDTMTLQQVQNFHCQLFFVHRDRIQRH